MRKLALPTIVAAICLLPAGAFAHTGGPLDADGCHADHRTGNYHCHRGAAAGYTFPNKPAMEEAVRTGVFPDKTVDEEGFFKRLWPFGKHHEEEETAAEGDKDSGKDSGKQDAGRAPAAGQAVVVPEKQREAQERLKVLQGLYEMGLITKEEYEAKRKTVLDQL